METNTSERIEELESQWGFDNCYETENGLHIGCTQCQALCINGTPCHEYGCPNWRAARRRRDEQEREHDRLFQEELEEELRKMHQEDDE